MKRVITNIVDFARGLSQNSPPRPAPAGLVNVVENAVVHAIIDVWHAGASPVIIGWFKRMPACRAGNIKVFRNELTFVLGQERLDEGYVEEHLSNEIDFTVEWAIEDVYQLTSPQMPTARPEDWVNHGQKE